MSELAVTLTLVNLLALPIYLLALYGLVSFFRDRQTGHKVNWTPLEAIGVTIFIYFAAQFVGGLLIGSYLATQNQSVQDIDRLLKESVSIQFFFILLVEAITTALIFTFLRKRKTLASSIGIVRLKLLRDIGYVLAGFAVYFVGFIVVVQILQQLAPGIDFDQKQELGFDTDAASSNLPLIFVSLVILPPLVEELLARGFLYSGLRTRLPFIWSALITSILFAIAHLQFGSGQPPLYVAAVDTFILSLVLVYMREKTGSLWPCVGLHMAKNGLAFVALFILHIS
jgi:membrane protease YdiL (CAAX protease family)